MVPRMSLCDRRQLELALADRLLAAQSEDLSQHLQGCPHCRTELEQLAGAGSWWSEARTFLSSSDELVAVEDSVEGTLRVPSAVHRTPSIKETDGTRSVPTTLADETSAPQDLHFLAPTEQPGSLGRLGNYEIEEVVGRGGMGIVLAARDPALARRVAIKVLAGHLSASAAARKRFAYEARHAAAVVHDHVIPIHAVDTSGQTPFLVMPFVTGRSLQDRLDACGTLELKELLRIAMQTADGLAAAHAQGLVHRDIKPANILLENGCERVRITDFGLARAVDDASQTQSGFIAGTPQYMAPEQARGEPIDARADLFSLGSVMYAMATGRPPFRAETTLAVLRRICDDPPRDVREVNPDIPGWLAAIIARLLAKSPADRFQTAGEVADLLRQWLAHLAQPTMIRQPAVVVVAKDQARRTANWQPWAIGGIAAAAIITVVGIGLWLSGALDRPAGGASLPIASNAAPPQTQALAHRPADTGRSPSEVPTGSRDLLDKDFQTELTNAWQETAAVEAGMQNLSADGQSIDGEVAALDWRVLVLEQELNSLMQRKTQNQPQLERSPE